MEDNIVLKKYLKPRDNHTARYKESRDVKLFILPTVQILGNIQYINDYMYIEYLTALENTIDIKKYTNIFGKINLNKSKLWDIIPKILEDNYINKYSYTNINRDIITTTYELPIINNKIVNLNNYNNKYYINYNDHIDYYRWSFNGGNNFNYNNIDYNIDYNKNNTITYIFETSNDSKYYITSRRLKMEGIKNQKHKIKRTKERSTFNNKNINNILDYSL